MGWNPASFHDLASADLARIISCLVKPCSGTPCPSSSEAVMVSPRAGLMGVTPARLHKAWKHFLFDLIACCNCCEIANNVCPRVPTTSFCVGLVLAPKTCGFIPLCRLDFCLCLVCLSLHFSQNGLSLRPCQNTASESRSPWHHGLPPLVSLTPPFSSAPLCWTYTSKNPVW